MTCCQELKIYFIKVPETAKLNGKFVFLKTNGSPREKIGSTINVSQKERISLFFKLNYTKPVKRTRTSCALITSFIS